MQPPCDSEAKAFKHYCPSPHCCGVLGTACLIGLLHQLQDIFSNTTVQYIFTLRVRSLHLDDLFFPWMNEQPVVFYDFVLLRPIFSQTIVSSEKGEQTLVDVCYTAIQLFALSYHYAIEFEGKKYIGKEEGFFALVLRQHF